MSVKVKLCSMMRQSADWQEFVEANGNTPKECLDDLERQYPDIRRWIYDKHGEMWPRLQLYVNDEIIYEEELNNHINDGDELYVLLNIGGG